jgi:hypothetical protein
MLQQQWQLECCMLRGLLLLLLLVLVLNAACSHHCCKIHRKMYFTWMLLPAVGLFQCMLLWRLYCR